MIRTPVSLAALILAVILAYALGQGADRRTGAAKPRPEAPGEPRP